jgi:uncharacterized protein
MNPVIFNVIEPTRFKQIPWKNGQGVTTELAINEQGTVDNFTWRLSIATVTENGQFSDFSGYWRQLILLDGHGILLDHGDQHQDQLEQPLAMAQFDGAKQTVGTLLNGAIRDFNIMTKQTDCTSKVFCYAEHSTVCLPASDLCFVYSHSHDVHVQQLTNVPLDAQTSLLAPQHLLKLTSLNSAQVQITGSKMIVICINKRTDRAKN